MAAEYAEAKEILGDSVSVLEAVRFFVAHGGNQLESRSTPDVVAEYLKQKAADGASLRHLEDLRNRLNRFGEAFPMAIDSITTPELQRWLNGLQVAARTRNNYRSKLVALFSFAQTQGYLPKNTDTAPQALTKAKDQGGAIEIFTPEQMQTLLHAAQDDRIRVYLALGAFTGLRTAELQRLDWQDISLEHGHVEVKAGKAKTAQRRLVPIQPNLRAWLEKEVQKSGPVFTRKSINHLVADSAREQGIEWPSKGMRHSNASYRLADCQDAPKVALEMGNSPQIVFRNYRAVVSPSLAEQWWQIAPSPR